MIKYGHFAAQAFLVGLVSMSVHAAPVRPQQKRTATARYPANLPVDFKGARLGMPIAEWKNIPFPKGGQEDVLSLIPGSEGPVSPVCSDDEHSGPHGSDVYVGAYEAAAGVVECRYRARLRHGLRAAWVAVGDGGSDRVLYRFLAGSLYEISVTASGKLRNDVLEGLTAKFGPPSLQTVDTVQTGLGIAIPHQKLTWVSGERMVTYEQPFGSSDELNVLYVNTTALTQVQRAREAAHPAASKM